MWSNDPRDRSSEQGITAEGITIEDDVWNRSLGDRDRWRDSGARGGRGRGRGRDTKRLAATRSSEACLPVPSGPWASRRQARAPKSTSEARRPRMRVRRSDARPWAWPCSGQRGAGATGVSAGEVGAQRLPLVGRVPLRVLDPAHGRGCSSGSCSTDRESSWPHWRSWPVAALSFVIASIRGSPTEPAPMRAQSRRVDGCSLLLGGLFLLVGHTVRSLAQLRYP